MLAGGGFQNYPEDYQIIEELHRDGQLTVRIAYNLMTQKPKEELKDLETWAKQIKPGQGDDSYRSNGAPTDDRSFWGALGCSC